MTTPTPAQAVTAIRDFGVEFLPYPFDDRPWHTFTTAGAFAPVGVAHHHTTGSAALLTPNSTAQRAMLRLLRVGTSTLDGPLCHFAPVFLGTGRLAVYGIGWGNTNHAGTIGSNVADHLRRGIYGGARPVNEISDGNAMLWGLEYLHPGDGTPWPDELLDAGHRTAAALSQACGWSPETWAGSQAEHRELTTRKIDRSWPRWGTGLREAVAALAQGDTVSTQDVLDALKSPAGQAAIRRAVLSADLTPKIPDDKKTVRDALKAAGFDNLATLQQALRDLPGEVAALLPAGANTVTPQQVEAACAEAVRRVLGGLDT